MSPLAEIRLIVELALGGVFLLSTVAKLRDPRAFIRGVADYHILRPPLVYWLASLLIPLEGFVSIAHLTGWGLTLGISVGVGLLVTFAVAVGVNLKRGRIVDCHCFSSGSTETISKRTLARLCLLLSGETLLLTDSRPFAANRLVYPDQASTIEQLGFAMLLAAFLGAAGTWLLRTDELIEMWTTCRACSR